MLESNGQVCLFLPRLTDGTGRIFISYHLMPRPGFELTSVELAPLLWDLNSGLLYRLSYRDRGTRMQLNRRLQLKVVSFCGTIPGPNPIKVFSFNRSYPEISSNQIGHVNILTVGWVLETHFPHDFLQPP